MDSLDAYRPLVERLAAALGPSEADADDEADEPGDPMADMFSGMLRCSSRWCWP